MKKKERHYLIWSIIILVILVFSVLADEHVSFYRCMVFRSFNMEVKYLAKYPDSKHDIYSLLQQKEDQFIMDSLSNLKVDDETKAYKIGMIQDSYKRYGYYFPNGKRKEEVTRFVEYASSILEDRKKYIGNSIINGGQPYSSEYGSNMVYGNCRIEIKSSSNTDCVVIVKLHNLAGPVVGHVYVRRGFSSGIYLPYNEDYQVCFYSGVDWNPNKTMPNGLKGGFMNEVSYLYDEHVIHLDYGDVMEYSLSPTTQGNFIPGSTSQSNIF